MRRLFIALAWLIALGVGGVVALRLYAPCVLAQWVPHGLPSVVAACAAAQTANKAAPSAPLPPAVTVASVTAQDFADTIFVSGTLVARNEALVGAPLDGLRLVELLAEDGDRVSKGQVLAKLDRSQLDALLAQSDAALLRADAAIAQATSQIGQYEASAAQAGADLDRAEKLGNGVLTQTVLDQRTAAARTTKSQLAAARDALALAKADKASRAAERRELQVRIDRAEIKAPVAGVVSRRTARIGAVMMGSGEAMFRIIEDGAIDLEADVPQQFISRLQPGMKAQLRLSGASEDIPATIRLISQEIDKTTRTGKVRIAAPPEAGARIGAFATGVIVVARRNGLGAPASALLRAGDDVFVQGVRDGRVEMLKVTTGIAQGDRVELRDGVSAGDILVARAAAFLRGGDLVRPIAAKEAIP